MTAAVQRLLLLASIFLGGLVLSATNRQESRPAPQEDVPAWVRRGIPAEGHSALAPLIGIWRAQLSVYGTMGRSPELPPIVSDDITTKREWVAAGQYIEDQTEGTLNGQLYWRRGWLGYSNMDRRYEWVTIAPRVPMMIYLGKPGSVDQRPIEMTGVFTDQGVVKEETVGKTVGQRTSIAIQSDDRHTFELYFTPPGEPEHLAMRMVFTRVK